MAELGGLAETLVLSLALVEKQLLEKLWVLRALQLLSSSGQYRLFCQQLTVLQFALWGAYNSECPAGPR